MTDVLRCHGTPLDATARRLFEPRFGFDFSRVRIHTDARAAESARAVEALAYTVGHDIVFDAGQYAPHTGSGQRILAHELAHVVQQSSASREPRDASPPHPGELGANDAAGDVLAGHRPSAITPVPPTLQRFTASQGPGDTVQIHPEKADTDADLDKVLCPSVKGRKIGKRKDIDVTECLPKSTVKAMSLGPYNCADFVRSSLGDFPASKSTDVDRMLTPKLWDELLKKRFTLRGFAVVKKDGTVKPAEGLSWKQAAPRMGDIVFMRGGILLSKGAKEPSAKGDNFTVTWDHVGIFIVRSRSGLDYHFAKDGDENPLGVYHTGAPEEEGMTPGAYVKGVETIAAYLAPPPEPKTEPKPKGETKPRAEPKKERKSEAPTEKAPAPLKLAVDRVADDPLEREADRIADAVLGGRSVALGHDFSSIAVDVGPVSPKRCGDGCGCAKCRHHDMPLIRRAAADGYASAPAPPSVDNVIGSPGAPLAPPAREFFEGQFGVSLADVRVHAGGGGAAESAREVDARAYTVGRHIVFGRGEYDPDSPSGRWLLAHELAHVVQGGDGRVRRKGNTAGDVPPLRFEPAVNQPPCACVVSVHNEERKARKTARLLHANCRYNVATVQDPEGLKARNIQVPKHGEQDPNSLFPAEIVNTCMADEQGCRDFLTAKKTSTKPDDILGFAQRQYFLAIKDCSNGFALPVVGLHNNALSDTAAYRAGMVRKSVADLKLDVDKASQATGADVLETLRARIKEKFGARGVRQTLETPRTTNIYRWCGSPDIERCHVGNPEHPDNVVWVTNPADFDRLKATDTNVVLESPKAKPPTSESAGDLSTMFVLLALRLADEWSKHAGVARGILEERALRAISDTLRPFLLLGPEAEDAVAEAKNDKALQDAVAAMTRLAGQAANLRFVNIETEGKEWGKESERAANFRAIVSVLADLGIHCCDVAGKGDPGVEAGLKGEDT